MLGHTCAELRSEGGRQSLWNSLFLLLSMVSDCFAPTHSWGWIIIITSSLSFRMRLTNKKKKPPENVLKLNPLLQLPRLWDWEKRWSKCWLDLKLTSLCCVWWTVCHNPTSPGPCKTTFYDLIIKIKCMGWTRSEHVTLTLTLPLSNGITKPLKINLSDFSHSSSFPFYLIHIYACLSQNVNNVVVVVFIGFNYHHSWGKMYNQQRNWVTLCWCLD